MKKQITLLTLLLLSIVVAYGGTGIVKGTITSKGEAVPGCFVQIKGIQNVGSVSDISGNFIIENVPEGSHILNASCLGFHSSVQEIKVSSKQTITKNIDLQEDLLNIEEVVVTGTRNAVAIYKAPVIVSKISPTLFESTQSLSLSEGLAFSPGLRVETNCQNCGFSQLRMNGLEGAYSQILINSRPIYSALVGVYGLDMLPANMIDRVEIVKGGGSAMYGGSAIGGTVNIITKDPLGDSFQFGINQAFTDMNRSDRTLSVNGSIVSEDLNKGISIYGFNRNRKPWDANDDGFSEMTKLDNNTFGFDAFWNTTDKSKLKVNMHSINEFRRGGNKFELKPHETDVTEQLDHKIIGGGISFEQYTNDYKHKFSIYTSIQDTKRKSYYGGGGRVFGEGSLTEDDVTALNSYGNSKDISSATGLQYNYDISKVFTLSAGAEHKFNEVNDKMPGYNRSIDQEVNTLGSYIQLEIKPIEALTLLVGGRYDHVNIDGKYKFDSENFNSDESLGVFVPRISAMYDVNKEIKLRASYAQGYRAPQAFDEDLHIETVGGGAVFVQLSPNLEIEKSNNITASFNYTKAFGDFQTNFVLEGFYTQINDPFIISDKIKESAGGVEFKEKRNGDGLDVFGGNIEFNFAYTKKFLAQLGLTIQKSKYETDEAVWEPKDKYKGTNKAIFTDHILRTPDVYGFFSFTYRPIEAISLSWSGVYSGKMDVPHVIGDDFDEEYTIIKETPSFLENNFKISYDFDFDEENCLVLSAGIQNAFNSFQDDFDKGAGRDAGYIYGPRRPRTVFVGLKYSFAR